MAGMEYAKKQLWYRFLGSGRAVSGAPLTKTKRGCAEDVAWLVGWLPSMH